MSIAVLKRKSSTKHSKNISVGNEGFAINGKLRVKGWVGETNLARTVKGTCSTPQNTVKLSTLTTKSGIKHKHSWLKGGGYPYKPGALGFWTQAGMTGTENIQGSAGEYIENLSTTYVGSEAGYNEVPNAGIINCDNTNKEDGCKSRYVGSVLKPTKQYTKDLRVNRTTQAHLYRLKYQCINPDKNQKPFPFKINHQNNSEGCNINYKTYQDAQNASAFGDLVHPTE